MTNIKKIYDSLKEVYPTLSVTRKDEAIEWAELKPEHENIPDYYLLLNFCYGPWRESRQKLVWKRAYTKFQSIGEIRKLDDKDISNLDLPFGWQRERIKQMRDYLRKEATSLQDFLTRLEVRSGIEIRDKFREIMGGNSTKVYSTFIRDFMEKDDVFPIDSRVYSMLNKLGLPKDEKLMIEICREHGIPPTLFEGFLYRFKDNFCEKNKYAECPISDECWCYKIEKRCCKI